jgi:hypothetical protein
MLNMFNLKKIARGITFNLPKKTEMNNFFKNQFSKYQFAEAAKKEADDKGKIFLFLQIFFIVQPRKEKASILQILSQLRNSHKKIS